METTTTTTTITAVKTPPEEPSKPLLFTNGVLKLHHPQQIQTQTSIYKECQKNHAASMGCHALDGCGEFMSSPNSLLCAACGCHRNFHRRYPSNEIVPISDFHPHHRHRPPPPPLQLPASPNSPSPPPISSTYYPSAPHMLLALSSNPNPNAKHNAIMNPTPSSSSRKRFRTRFTQGQKDKMFEFAEKLGWKMQRRDEEMINEFCDGIGVDKGVFKVWMHNNKNTLGNKREVSGSGGAGAGTNSVGIRLDNLNHGNNSDEVSAQAVGTNVSSSSS